jgi:integral membrane protein (TIGR01906 family)
MYHDKFIKYGVNEKYNWINLDAYNEKVLDYLKGKSDAMPSDIMLSERELSHMKDVRNVFSFSFRLLILLSILFLVSSALLTYYSKREKLLKKVIVYSGIISLSMMIVLGAFFYFGFDRAFTYFHRMFFSGDSWLFLSTDNIINIYPSGLFFDIASYIFFASFSISLLVLVFGVVSLKRSKIKSN